MNKFYAIILSVVTAMLLLCMSTYAQQADIQTDETKLLTALGIISDASKTGQWAVLHKLAITFSF